MKLLHIIEKINFVNYKGDIDIEIFNISSNSKKINNSGIFIAIEGLKFNGNDYIDEAIYNGAKVIITENDLSLNENITIIKVKCSRTAFAEISKIFYNKNCNNLRFIGITGTNGKTTTSFMIKSILDLKNKKNGLIGTIHNEFANYILPSLRTTPEADELHQLLNRMERSGCENVIMEVSSHALTLKRVAGIKFDLGIFTNLSEEHLDFHSSMNNYFNQKKTLFNEMKNDKCPIIVNIDDCYGDKLYNEFKKQTLTYGLSNDAMYRASKIRIKNHKTIFKLDTPKNKNVKFMIPFIGTHNIYNALAAIVTLSQCGLKIKDIRKNFVKVKSIPGRLQLVSKNDKKQIYIDYAHTVDSLKIVLQTLKKIRHRKLWLVFGCGGNRDTTKRKKMGKIASMYSDEIIITSDNPRDENPLSICKEIISGCKNGDNVEIIVDRKKAIKSVLTKSNSKDIILIAGRGHENYQEIKGEMIPFNDAKIIDEVINDQ